MADLEIHPFTVEDVDDLRSSMEILNASSALDAPWDNPFTEKRYTVLVGQGWDGEPPTPYLATVEGRPVATALRFLPQRDNTHLAWFWIAVHPDERRRGYGSALFERMVEEAKAAGRTSIGTDGWESEKTLAFAAKHGLEKKSQAIMRRQPLADLPDGLIQKLYDEAAPHADDYELVRIVGRTPPELVDAMVELASAINDAPTDDLDIEDEVFTAERLAAYEDASMARGNRMYRLVARHKETGALGGHTVVVVREEDATKGDQHDTAVSREHRGHRLGMLLKTGMLLWLAEVEPDVASIDTFNAESNDHMISVNEQLGYVVLGRELQFQRDA